MPAGGRTRGSGRVGAGDRPGRVCRRGRPFGHPADLDAVYQVIGVGAVVQPGDPQVVGRTGGGEEQEPCEYNPGQRVAQGPPPHRDVPSEPDPTRATTVRQRTRPLDEIERAQARPLPLGDPRAARLRASFASMAAARASSRRARSATGMSTIFPSTPIEARPSASAASKAVTTFRACSTSPAAGEKYVLSGATWAGWMQLAPM